MKEYVAGELQSELCVSRYDEREGGAALMSKPYVQGKEEEQSSIP